MEINMNGNTNDTSYRYTMNALNVTVAGKGNGIYTIFNNIEDICKSMNHPVEVVMGYIAASTGSNYIASRNTITGTHNTEELTAIILEYIKQLVMCPVCNIPETIPKMQGTKKNASLILCCSACKNETPVKGVNKRITKGIDIILKYIKTGNVWTTSKGTMVVDTTVKTTECEINPFDLI
jgi:translation initiation factor 5